jgi:AraC-like DNA-binding protein
VNPSDESNERAVLTVAGWSEPMELLSAEYRHHTFAPHFHETYAVGIVDRGAVEVRCRGAAHLLRPGAVLVIEPGEVHTARSADGSAWRYRSLYPRTLPGAERDGGDGWPAFEACVFEGADLAAAVGALHRALAAGEDPLREDVLRHEALATLVRRHARGRVPGDARERGREPAAVARAREYLHAHVASRVTLADVATAAGISAFHVIRVFRRAVGVPPYAYLELLRVERAKALLREGMTASRAAYASGFSDQSHLTRRFKRVVGVTPGVYARRLRLAGCA